MQTMTPPSWPKGLPRVFKPLARLRIDPRHPDYLDRLAVAESLALSERLSSVQASGTTGTWSETMFVNTSDYSAFASSASEGSLLSGGGNEQPSIPALYWFNKQGRGRLLVLYAQGVFSNTGTPTLTFQVRLGTTSGPTFLSGGSIGVSAAITTASGISNKWWQLRLDMICTVTGTGTGNSTLAGAGFVTSPGGFASPFIYPLEPTTPDTATWTQTFDNSLTQYINLSVTWSASSASNTITCKQCILEGKN